MIDISFEDIVEKLNGIDVPVVDLVLGIGTGGIVPAALISKKLGARLSTLIVEHRDEENNIKHSEPKMMGALSVPGGIKSVLVVDDVSVTGRTLDTVCGLLNGVDVKTLVFKGKADYVVFPDVKPCVNWPWKKINTQ